MPWSMRVALGLAVCLACVAVVVGQEPPANPKVKVDLRWVEDTRIEGLTEDKGFQATCDEKSIVYPHKKPALVLTAAEVAEARLTRHDFSKSGSGVYYSVTLHLTKEARDKLATACGNERMRALTVVVDGRFWGVHRYVKYKDEPSIPAAARAETYLPFVGFFSSQAEAERLVEAFK